jgi:putative redox protein
MKAIARHTKGMFTHVIDIRGHRLTVDEPVDRGGADEGPTPQELLAASIASCTAITLGIYANRKGWDLGQVEVECEYETAERGSPTQLNVVVRLPDSCSEEQVNKLRVIAAKCPVHRLLEGESIFEERIELVAPVRT